MNQLSLIDKQMEVLKPRITDELENKFIVTSDREFDDLNVDPRYETSKYTNPKNEPVPLTIPKNKSSIIGLYKGNNVEAANIRAKQAEALQRAKVEKQIRNQKERQKLLRSTTDSEVSVSEFNKHIQESRKQIKKAQELERERARKAAEEPIRPGFDYLGDFDNYDECVPESTKLKLKESEYDASNDPAFDCYSRMYLSRRYLPADIIAKQFADTQVLRLNNFFERLPGGLKELSESNFIIVGMVMQKSEPLTTRDGRSKFIKVTLSNFRVDLILYLFGDAYEKYWKVRLGSIIAVLNPEIQDRGYQSKNPNGASVFVLKATDRLGILEYARFRDMGICPGLKGQKCGMVANTRLSPYCFYHMNKRNDSNASKRNEMGSNYKLFDPTDKHGNKQVMVVSERQIESMSLVNEFQPAKKKGGLAIENVPKNPPLKGRDDMNLVLIDYSNPLTVENMKTEDEKARIHFSTANAGAAFRNPHARNLDAVERQERRRELDKVLLKQQMEADPILKTKAERDRIARNVKKRNILHALETKKELEAASKQDKSLKKDKSTILQMKRNREEVHENHKINKLKRFKMLTDAIDIRPVKSFLQTKEPSVALSSDDDDGDDDSDDFDTDFGR